MTSMTYVWFPGCKIPYHLPRYGRASLAVFRALGVELLELEFGCCGYPARHLSVEASVLSAARNLALAHAAGATILTPCKCCFGNLRHAVYWLQRVDDLRRRVQTLLTAEGLALPPDLEQAAPRHLLTVLDQDVGAKTIASAVRHPLRGLRVAAQYGCHALRPGNVTRFDNPLQPTVFERLVEATGAVAVPWATRLDCCGNPLHGRNTAMALRLTRKKQQDARSAGAEVLCTACTYCQLQFDGCREELADSPAQDSPLDKAPPAVLYPELLGAALGLDEPETLQGLGRPAHHGPGIAQTPSHHNTDDIFTA
ncbi:CoB--CoM heterodisulfide reductase iron-sulfur subunit B family protein [Megalodesulfovibrio paquesii]